MSAPPRPALDARTASRQRGAALMVAMVMIFVLSIMGVSAMRGSTLERRMAINAVQSAVVFQAAESATEIALDDTDVLTGALSPSLGAGQWIEPDVAPVRADVGLDSTVQIRHTGSSLPPGFSAGGDGSGFTALRFETRSAVRADTVGVAAGVEQGAYRVVPAP